jgi:hypothetical protein
MRVDIDLNQVHKINLFFLLQAGKYEACDEFSV